VIDVLSSLGESNLDLHSSIVLTYSFDLVLYDGLIRRRLRQAGVVNQMIFSDFGKYIEQLAAVTSVRHFGKSYSVTPVPQAAAFHPKLYMVLGRKGGRLLIGSGNATIGGMLRNAETFGLFEYERGRDTGPHPVFHQCFEFIEQISRETSGIASKQLARARSWTPWLESPTFPDHRTVLISGRGRKPLLDQIRELIGDRAIQEILLCTSSVDRRLAALRELAELTKRGKVRCIVQPEQLQIDGEAVRRLGKLAEWRPFVDPYPRGKKKRPDVYAHAKLIVFNCGDREVLVYGSANASKQAYLETNGNTEIVVAFEPWANGSTAKRLGLSESLKAKDIAKQLMERTWEADQEKSAVSYPIVLTAAVPMPNGISVHVASGKVPVGAVLHLSEMPDRSATLHGKVTAGAEGLFVRLPNIPSNLRIAQVVAKTGERLSNAIGLTWPEVASVQSSSGINARSEAAILAMQDGMLLGTVLFELLDQYRDFEVVRGRGPHKPETANQNEPNIDRPMESFYTHAVPENISPTSWTGDRTDLDLLAALVQPLQTGIQKLKPPIDEEDEVNDSVLEEEAERREIDSKGGRATGQERNESPSLTSTEALERASRRLQRRLDRAAGAVERALAQRSELANIPAAGLARQIWMAHIAAFLAGREAPTSDGDQVLCLGRRDFAEYILRVCRALAGGKDGGLLHLVSKDTFAGPDGDSLRAGLSFLWTCLIFAVAEIATLWANSPTNVIDEDEEIEYACDVWDAVPELVAARFILAVQPHCRKPDLLNITRRLPAWDQLAEGWFDEWKVRIDHLADFIERVEIAKDAPAESIQVKSPLKAGNLVLNDALGVTALAAMGDNRKCYLVDFSRSDEENPRNALRVFFSEQVKGLVVPPIVREPGWRSPEWLVSESD
jgi:hypothetical protein